MPTIASPGRACSRLRGETEAASATKILSPSGVNKLGTTEFNADNVSALISKKFPPVSIGEEIMYVGAFSTPTSFTLSKKLV